MTLWYVPIQPLEERYTEQWYRWFPEEFRKAGYNVKIVDGEPLTDKIEKGAFLDVNGATYYTLTQLQKITRAFRQGKVDNEDIFFFGDIEFPGYVETIKRLAELQNVKVKLYGFLHAGSYTKEDFVTKLAPWHKYFELGWIKVCDGVFVGSQYHKDAITERRIRPYVPDPVERMDLEKRIHVTGNPWNTKEVLSMVTPLPEKEDIIIFPNRFDYEKRPNLFLDLCLILHKEFPSLKFLITSSRPSLKSSHPWLVKLWEAVTDHIPVVFRVGLTKEEYYQLMAKSKIMFSSSIEENFGYTVLEALTFETRPLCPNKYSYPELLQNNDDFLYEDMDDALNKIEFLLEQKFIQRWSHPYTEYYDTSIQRMIKIMEEDFV